MSIRLLLVLVWDETFDEDITDSFSILCWYIFALHDRKTHLKIIRRLLADVPNLAHIFCFSSNIDIKPQVDNSLVKLATWMIKLSCFDRFFVNCLPFRVEESVVQVNCRLSNQVISKHHVVVISFDYQRWRSWEGYIEVEAFDELGIWLVILVIFLVINNLIAARDNQKWITGGTNISRRKLEALNQIQVHDSISLVFQCILDKLFKCDVLQEFG